MQWQRGWTLALAVGFAAGAVRAEGSAPADLECLIQPLETVTLAFAVEGVVGEVLVDQGDFVKQGQLLARLRADAEEAALAVAQARAGSKAGVESGHAQLDYAKHALERQIRLKKSNVVSAELADQAARDEQVARAALLDAQERRRVDALEVKRAEAVLAMRRVESPFDAVVVKRILAPGEWADPPAVLEIARIDPLRVEVFAPIDLFGAIAPGSHGQVMPDPPIGGSYPAAVTVVDRVVDAASGTFGVRLELPNPDYRLPAGVRCRIRFDALGLAISESGGTGE